MIDLNQKLDQIQEPNVHKKNKATVFISFLMKLANNLIKEGRPLKENCLTLIDCLLNSVKILSMYAKNLGDSNQIYWFNLLIMIRRLFLCFDTLFTRLESDALSFTDTLEEVLCLQSLKDLIDQVPSSCERIRNLF